MHIGGTWLSHGACWCGHCKSLVVSLPSVYNRECLRFIGTNVFEETDSNFLGLTLNHELRNALDLLFLRLGLSFKAYSECTRKGINKLFLLVKCHSRTS